jgi:Zn-dependent protease
MFTLLFSDPLVFIVWLLAFLVALSFHEFSHALVGTWLGDTTAKRMGRLTLNPAAHVDVLGLLAVVFIGFGWGKPVPFNPYNLKWPKWGPVAVAAAGPISNLLLAVISALLLVNLGPHLGENNLLFIFLAISAELNVALMVFNLVPLPPLDGSKALLAVLSHPKYVAARDFIEHRGPMVLLMIILLDSMGHLGIFSTLFGLGARLITLITGVPLNV